MTQAPDALLVTAVSVAQDAAVAEAGGAELVGAWVGVESDDERLATHLFEAHLPGYTAWRWAVTIARTIDDHTRALNLKSFAVSAPTGQTCSVISV